MSEHDDKGAADKGAEQTDAERFAGLEADNKILRTRIQQLEDIGVDAETREARLKAAEATNAALQAEHGTAVLREAIRAAAETLNVDPEVALNLYGHKFKTTIQPNGRVQIEPNVTETLAVAVREHPLLRGNQQTVEQRASDRATLRDPGADAQKMLAALDRDAAAKGAYVEKHGGEAYMKLVQADRLKRQEAKQLA